MTGNTAVTLDSLSFGGFKWPLYESQKEDGWIRSRADPLLRLVDWHALQEYASSKREGVQCVILPDIGLGGRHMVRILKFDDGEKWVARFLLPDKNGEWDLKEARIRMENDYYTAALVRAETQVPVPAMHAIEPTNDNVVRAPFSLMDCIEGNSARDLGWETPSEYRTKFIEQWASIHVSLVS